MISDVYSFNMRHMRMINDKDATILNLLQKNARISNAEVARTLHLAPSAVFERIRKLEERGIIQRYEVRLDPRLLDKGMLVFVFVKTDEQVGGSETAKQLAKIPEVQEVHHISGDDCYLLKVRVADTQELSRLMRERFGRIKSIRSTRTTIVFDTVKESAHVVLSPQDRGTDSNSGEATRLKPASSQIPRVHRSGKRIST